MAEVRQTTVNPEVPTTKPFGARNEINLKASFASSPIHQEDYTDDVVRDLYQSLALDGTVVNGLGFNSVSRDFSDAPDLSNVETGGGGLPATPYVPNLASPGPGSISPSDQVPYDGEIPDPGVEFGSGLGGLTSPSDTSTSIAEESSQAILTIGSYLVGSSYKGSNGQG